MRGFLLLDKSAGLTSFAEVNRVKRLSGEKHCGHTGTLDPLATGVLPVAVGEATRFIPYLPDTGKSYSAQFCTGYDTDTYDRSGAVVRESGRTASLDEIQSVLPNFSGDILQEPPMYSALKKDGVRLYDLARRGIETARESRPCTVDSISVSLIEDNLFSLTLDCSSGTYVRSIIHDIGALLGCGAVMTALRRTAACGFSISQCHPFEFYSLLSESGGFENALLPIEEVFSVCEKVFVTPAQAVRFQNGGYLSRERLNQLASDGTVRVYTADGVFLGIGSLKGERLDVCRALQVY